MPLFGRGPSSGLRRFLILLCIGLVVVPAQALAGTWNTEPAAPDPDIHIIVSEGGAGDDGRPRWVAMETLHLLRDVGGLHDIQTTYVEDASGLLRAIAGTQAKTLMIIGHGSPAGLDTADGPLSWSRIVDAASGSAAERLFLGACYSSLAPKAEAIQIYTTFEGLVDHRVVPGTLAYELFRDVLPEREPLFISGFETYIAQTGGLVKYAMLMVQPTAPLTSAEACRQIYSDWLQGDSSADSRGKGCIHYIDPTSSLNCHDPANAGHDTCRKLTAQDQERWQQESQHASGDIRYETDGEAGGGSDGESSGSTNVMFDALARKLRFSAQGEGGEIYVAYGNVGMDDCTKIVTLRDLGFGILTRLIVPVLKGLTGHHLEDMGGGNEAPSFGLRLCGKMESDGIQMHGNTASYSSAGQMDIRLSGRASAEWTVRVWRWDVTLTAGVEGGIRYNFRPAVDASLTWCEDDSIGFATEIGLDAGPLEIFGYAVTAYKEFGMVWDLGAEFSHSFAYNRSCPSAYDCYGWECQYYEGSDKETGDAAVTPRADEILLPSGAVDVLHTNLLRQGLLVRNSDPTLLNVQEDGATVHLKSSLIQIRPGTPLFADLLDDGILSQWGVDHIAVGQKLIVDGTHPVAAQALGMGGTVTPIYSLTHPAIIAPDAAAPSQAIISYCSMEPGKYGILEERTCEGLLAAPEFEQPQTANTAGSGCSVAQVPTYPAGGTIGRTPSPPAVAFDVEDGPSVTTDEDSSVFLGVFQPHYCVQPVIGLLHEETPAECLLIRACRDDVVADAQRDVEGVKDNVSKTAEDAIKGEGAFSNVQKLSLIHESFQILTRYGEVVWSTTKCAVEDLDENAEPAIEYVQQEAEDTYHFLTNSTLQAECMDWVVDVPSITIEQVEQEFRAGLDLIRGYALHAHHDFRESSEVNIPRNPLAEGSG